MTSAYVLQSPGGEVEWWTANEDRSKPELLVQGEGYTILPVIAVPEGQTALLLTPEEKEYLRWYVGDSGSVPDSLREKVRGL